MIIGYFHLFSVVTVPDKTNSKLLIWLRLKIMLKLQIHGKDEFPSSVVYALF